MELTAEEEGEALFVLALLEDSFGGTPSLGIADDKSYTVFSQCGCDRCHDFRSVYQPKTAKSLLAAAKVYGDDRLCFKQTEEMTNSGTRKH